jgi:sugar O-acyltransferase (sialic acid O-acetyltransferase NeuD family)
MRIHLLGYSESTVSRILDALLLHGYPDEIIIVKNIEVKDTMPVFPPGIKYKFLNSVDWRFDASSQTCLLGVMRPGVKKAVYDYYNQHAGVQQEHYTTIAHPSAVIASTVEVGKSCFIEPGTVIASFARIGFGVYVNRGSTIGHHTSIGDFCSINPGVHVAGHCTIGDCTQLGIGSVVFDKVKIGSNVLIGGGSVVTKDIPDNVVAFGNPCRVIRPNEKN